MKMLIVDDDAMVVDFLSHVARGSGYKDIETADSGEAALSKMMQNKFDLITLDIEMPGMSGLEVLPLMRNMCPHTLIVIISGHIPEDALPDVVNCADLAFHKPINLDLFNDLMDHANRLAQTLASARALSDVSLVPNKPTLAVSP